MAVESSFQSILKNNNYSITKPRKLVFEALQKNQPISVSRLAHLLRTKVDRASVYRAVTLFEQLGIAQKVWLGFRAHIELSEAFSTHHHHLTCLQCGSVIAVEDYTLENNLAAIAGRFGFIPQAHQVEISGTCLACQQLGAASAQR